MYSMLYIDTLDTYMAFVLTNAFFYLYYTYLGWLSGNHWNLPKEAASNGWLVRLARIVKWFETGMWDDKPNNSETDGE